jgi:hypothetical protein
MVEDTPATFEDLEREFGADVTQLVKELTDVSRPGDGSRAVRKVIDRRHTAAASPRAQTIKLADIIDNCEDICRHDAKFGHVYLGEAALLLEVLTEGHEKLQAEAARVISRCKAKLGLVAAVDSSREEPAPAHGSGKPAIAGRHGIRLFMEAFAARDVQEPLPSFDVATVNRLPLGEWPWANLQVAGVRENGLTTGYLIRDDPPGERPHRIRPIDQRQLVALDASLTDVIHVLTHFSHCFVELDGAVVGLVGRGDIEKPVVRMWLFGIIILIEVQVVELIRDQWPDDGWVGTSARDAWGRLASSRASESGAGFPPTCSIACSFPTNCRSPCRTRHSWSVPVSARSPLQKR